MRFRQCAGPPADGQIRQYAPCRLGLGGHEFRYGVFAATLGVGTAYPFGSMVVDESGEAAFARSLGAYYPNVTLIRVKEAIATMRDVLTNLGLGMRAMSGLTLLAGILVLAGAMASGHRARVYDAVVMKVLGATRARILAFALEYALMGLGAALIAASVGTLAAHALITGPMQAEFVFLPITLALTVLGAVS